MWLMRGVSVLVNDTDTARMVPNADPNQPQSVNTMDTSKRQLNTNVEPLAKAVSAMRLYPSSQSGNY